VGVKVGNEINIDLDDLEPSCNDKKSNSNVLDISSESLKDIPAKSHSYVKPSSVKSANKKTFEPIAGVSRTAINMLIAGVIAGFIAWLIQEYGFDFHAKSKNSIIIVMGIWFAVISLVINLGLTVTDKFSSKNIKLILISALKALVIGAIIGFVAGVIAQNVYVFLGGGRSRSIILVFARTIGWGIAGAGLGLAQGILYGSFKKIVNGLKGGAIGGLIGGVLFDLIPMVIKVGGKDGGVISRMIGIVAIGGLVGYFIAVIDEISKEGWLLIKSGQQQGKQYILFNKFTTIGTHYSNDIVLIKDFSIHPHHCHIIHENSSYSIRTKGDSNVIVNGRETTGKRLSSGDIITIGSMNIQFVEKEKKTL